MKKRSLVQEATQNVVNQAKAYGDAMAFVDALANFGNRACHDYVGKKQFFDGLTMMRNALYAEQSEAIRRCFYFMGAGGEEAAEYSREMFSRVFSGKYEVMSFLDKWGQIPGSYKAVDQEAFLAECKEAMEDSDDQG